jgi:hypothetical protein
MRLFRVFPYDPGAPGDRPGHPLFIPRAQQGGGRHDNPAVYGALYLSERAVASVAEHLAHLRGQALEDADLERAGLRLALAEFDAPIEKHLHDLDEPRTLTALRLRPSLVATRERAVTQAWAARLYRSKKSLWGVRWWSTLEAAWMHVTLFGRGAVALTQRAPVERLHLAHPAVVGAAEALGLKLS